MNHLLHFVDFYIINHQNFLIQHTLVCHLQYKFDVKLVRFMSQQAQSLQFAKKQTIFTRAIQKIKNCYEIIKDYLQSFISLAIVISFFFPSFIFKLLLKCLDLSYQLIKLVFKICLRVFAGIINIYLAVFRLLGFIRLANYIQKKLDFILRKVKRTKSQNSQSGSQSSVSGLSESKQKSQEKYVINPPDIFSKKPWKAYNASTDEVEESQERQKNSFNENKNVVPQKEIIGNMVTLSNKVKSPTSFTNSNLHKFQMKRHPTEPNIFFTIQETGTTQNQNVKPDRDLSPQFQNDISFKKSSLKSSQLQASLNSNNSKLSQTHVAKVEQKWELQKQIDRLRKNMAQVVQKNNVQILQLQEWLTEKNLSLSIQKKQKVELIQKMEQLQKENKQKTLKYQLLEVNLKQIQKELMSQQFEKGNLLAKIDELQEEIKEKTIQIMILREKIRQNYEHVEMMSNLLDERIQQQTIHTNEINSFSVQNLKETNSSQISILISNANEKMRQESKQTIQESSSTILSSEECEIKEIEAELQAQEIQKKLEANNNNINSHNYGNGNGKGNKKNKKRNQKNKKQQDLQANGQQQQQE